MADDQHNADRRNYAETLAQHESRLDRLERDFHSMSSSVVRIEVFIDRLTEELRESKQATLDMLNGIVDVIGAQLDAKLLRHEKREEQKINQLLFTILGGLIVTVIIPVSGFFAWKLLEHVMQ